MTELQRIEFDLLKIFVDICEKLNLRYYLVCGSALGAVKYSGFIPWDDDLDVALPRKDYETFCEKAQSLLPDNIFLQNYKTDSAFPQFYSKLRNSRTTYIEKSVRHLKMNHGVYIDVFPLDGYPKDPRKAKKLEVKKRFLKLKLNCAFLPSAQQKMTSRTFYAIERCLGLHKRTSKTAKKIEELISEHPLETSDLWCNHGNWQGKLEYAPCDYYGDGAWVDFEGLQVRVPEKYDEYLTQKYGNWRAELPAEEQIGHHYFEVMDLSKSYTEYIKN